MSMGYKNILLDTSFLVSLFIKDDTNYAKATELLDTLTDAISVTITNYIYLETVTLLSQRIGKSGLREAIKVLDDLYVREIYIDLTTHTKVKSRYVDLTKKDISFVDISTAVVAKEHGVNAVLTFDRHFKYLGGRYGFEVLGV